MYVTGFLIVTGALGLGMKPDQPIHSAGKRSATPPSLPSESMRLSPDESFADTAAMAGLPEYSDPVMAASLRALSAKRADDSASSVPQIVEYTIQEGDTIWDIATIYGTDEDSILALNEVRPSAIQIGTTLKVPNFRGAVYQVESGDTIHEIADAYAMPVDEILKHNQIADLTALQVGQTLLLPGAKLQPSVRNAVASRGVSRSAWTWPISGGYISSEFGPRWGSHHNGLDIAVSIGTPAGAARAGEVIFAGWDGNYGLCVVIDHGDGIQTRYAHASAITVDVGDWVNAGEMIIRVGDTGFSTGPHLHFEVIVNGTAQNPRNYLP